MDDRAVRFHNRATILFVLLAVLYVLAIFLLLAVPDAPLSLRVAGVASPVLVLVAVVALVRGLDLGRPWAVPATVVACWLFVIAGIVEFLYGLTQATITFPLAAIGAALVLFVDPRSGADQRIPFSRPLLATTLALVVGLAAPAAAAAFAEGWLFGADQDDLSMTVTVACDHVPGATPMSATVETAWLWSRSEPFPASYDAIVIRWRTEGEGGDFGVAAYPTVDDAGGVWVGSSSPSAERAQAIEAESQPAVTIGIDLAKQQYADGRVQVSLAREPVATVHGTLVADAVYLHMDRWEKAADEVTCDW